MNEYLINTFNRCNYLINYKRIFSIFKHNNVLVLKLLDSLDDKWEHHVHVLKNSDPIKMMDLQILLKNLRNHKETKIQRKEIMWDIANDKYIALI